VSARRFRVFFSPESVSHDLWGSSKTMLDKRGTQAG
jgi:hypothetical protein